MPGAEAGVKAAVGGGRDPGARRLCGAPEGRKEPGEWASLTARPHTLPRVSRAGPRLRRSGRGRGRRRCYGDGARRQPLPGGAGKHKRRPAVGKGRCPPAAAWLDGQRGVGRAPPPGWRPRVPVPVPVQAMGVRPGGRDPEGKAEGVEPRGADG